MESSTERNEQAREYEAVHNRLFVVQTIVTLGLLLLFLFSGASALLADGLAVRFGADRWYLINAVYVAIVVFGFSACLFPFSYYGGHVLEHHYGLSNDSFGGWLTDFFKSLLLDLILIVILFSVIYALLRWMPNWWWLFSTLFYILFSVAISTIYPIWIMPLFHQFEPIEEGELSQAIRALVEKAGIKISGVYKWGLESKTSTANAAFTGIGKTRRIILSDTLLSDYTQEEILAILAHEVGHCKNRDTTRLMLTGSILAFLGFFLAHLFLSKGTALFGFEHIYDIGAAPLFMLALFIFSLVSMPFSNMHSRRREYAADAYAAQNIGSAEPLVSALEKLADQNLADREPAAWIEFFLHSHPSIGRRIQRLRDIVIKN